MKNFMTHTLQYENNFDIIINSYIINMEEEAAQRKDIKVFSKENFTAVAKDEKMENLNTSLKDITYSLICFFYKTNKKYSCTQTKLGKMISILAFKYAKNNQRLFNEPVYKYPPHCGTLIEDLVFIPKDIYTRDLDIEDPDKTDIISEDFNETVEIPSTYADADSLSFELKQEIENLFIFFGAYPASKLGEYLNPIVDKLVKRDSNEIILENILNISIVDFNENEINEIIKYIFIEK